MEHLQTDCEGVQLYEEWYSIIIDCILRLGGVIKNGKGAYKRFDPKSNRVVS